MPAIDIVSKETVIKVAFYTGGAITVTYLAPMITTVGMGVGSYVGLATPLLPVEFSQAAIAAFTAATAFGAGGELTMTSAQHAMDVSQIAYNRAMTYAFNARTNDELTSSTETSEQLTADKQLDQEAIDDGWEEVSFKPRSA